MREHWGGEDRGVLDVARVGGGEGDAVRLDQGAIAAVTAQSETSLSTVAERSTAVGEQGLGEDGLSVGNGQWGNRGGDASVSASVVEVHGSRVLLHISAGLVGGDLENGEHFEIETSLINNFI